MLEYGRVSQIEDGVDIDFESDEVAFSVLVRIHTEESKQFLVLCDRPVAGAGRVEAAIFSVPVPPPPGLKQETHVKRVCLTWDIAPHFSGESQRNPPAARVPSRPMTSSSSPCVSAKIGVRPWSPGAGLWSHLWAASIERKDVVRR